MLKEKNENLENSIDGLGKLNNKLHESNKKLNHDMHDIHESNNNLKQLIESNTFNSIASEIVNTSIAGAKGIVSASCKNVFFIEIV